MAPCVFISSLLCISCYFYYIGRHSKRFMISSAHILGTESDLTGQKGVLHKFGQKFVYGQSQCHQQFLFTNLDVKTNILIKLNPLSSENGIPEEHSQFFSSKMQMERQGLHKTGSPDTQLHKWLDNSVTARYKDRSFLKLL